MLDKQMLEMVVVNCVVRIEFFLGNCLVRFLCELKRSVNRSFFGICWGKRIKSQVDQLRKVKKFHKGRFCNGWLGQARASCSVNSRRSSEAVALQTASSVLNSIISLITLFRMLFNCASNWSLEMIKKWIIGCWLVLWNFVFCYGLCHGTTIADAASSDRLICSSHGPRFVIISTH